MGLDGWWEEEVRSFPFGGAASGLWMVRRNGEESTSPLELLLAWTWPGEVSEQAIRPAPLGRLLRALQSGRGDVSPWRRRGAGPGTRVAESAAARVGVGGDLALWTRPLARQGGVQGAVALLYDRRAPWAEAARLWGEGFAARATPLLTVLTPYTRVVRTRPLEVAPRQGRLFPDAVPGPAVAKPERRDVGLPRPAFLPELPGAVGVSRELRRCCESLDGIARSGVNVLLYGESGTGKEIIAHAIHRASGRRDGPFVGLNCAALPETLFESELFGHTAGAFTGARGDKRGLLAGADGGTFFLDEIGDMPVSMQIKLLRVMQERQVRRVGELEARPVDLRFVAATHKDLDEEVAAGRFRLDFYYRLKVVRLEIPPLRHRPEDITHLLAWFLRKDGTPARCVGERALAALQAYRWPGNVRELENEVERFRALYPGRKTIRLRHLSAAIRKSAGWSVDAADLATLRPLAEAGQLLERYLIRKAIAAANGHKAAAARRLGLSRQGLYKKIARYGMRDLIGTA